MLFTVSATCSGSSWVGCLWEVCLPNCHRIDTEASHGHCLMSPVRFTGDMAYLDLTENQRLRTLRLFTSQIPKARLALTLRTVRGISRPSPSLALNEAMERWSVSPNLQASQVNPGQGNRLHPTCLHRLFVAMTEYLRKANFIKKRGSFDSQF